MSRSGFATLAAKCAAGDEPALDDLVTYAVLDLCDPSGLPTLTAACYARLPLERTQGALDRLLLAGLITLGSVGGISTDLYVTN